MPTGDNRHESGPGRVARRRVVLAVIPLLLMPLSCATSPCDPVPVRFRDYAQTLSLTINATEAPNTRAKSARVALIGPYGRVAVSIERSPVTRGTLLIGEGLFRHGLRAELSGTLQMPGGEPRPISGSFVVERIAGADWQFHPERHWSDVEWTLSVGTTAGDSVVIEGTQRVFTVRGLEDCRRRSPWVPLPPGSPVSRDPPVGT
ncbi:MAG: hypothetical protein SF187_02315 [Deltaproteobacteria bacterium]|nr:hypothetical protein [Deltaproteobacteria bacterium]